MRVWLSIILSLLLTGYVAVIAQTKTPTQCNVCPPTNIELRAPVYNEEGKFLGIHKIYISKGSLPAGEECPDEDVKVKANTGEALIKKGWLDDPSHYKAVDKIPKTPKRKPTPRIIPKPDNMTTWSVEYGGM